MVRLYVALNCYSGVIEGVKNETVKIDVKYPSEIRWIAWCEDIAGLALDD